VFARRIVGWRVSSSMHADFVLDALEQALFDRQPARHASLIQHSDRGSARESVELATLQCVHWFNHIRLLGPIGYVLPAEAEGY